MRSTQDSDRSDGQIGQYNQEKMNFLLQDLFKKDGNVENLQESSSSGKGFTKGKKKGKKGFDFSALDTDKKLKMAEFNTKFDNTLLQLGEESEQIIMDTSDYFKILTDPKNKSEERGKWTEIANVPDE